MRVLLPLRQHANKQEDDEDDYLILVDSDTEDGPQYIVHSLPEAAAALAADPSRLTNPILFQARKEQVALEHKQGQGLVIEEDSILQDGNHIAETETGKQGRREQTTANALDSSAWTSIARLEATQLPQQAQSLLQDQRNLSLDVAEKPSTPKKRGSYKTTGLNTEETPAVTSSLVSRKRKAHSALNEGLKSVVPNQASLLADIVSPLDQKPAARKLSKSPGTPPIEPEHQSGPSNMVGGGSSRRIHQQWRYIHHPVDELRDEADDPAVSPEIMEAEGENNPESARGDMLFQASIPSNEPLAAAMNATAQYLPAATAISATAPSGFATRGTISTSGAFASPLTSGDSSFHEVLKKRGLEIREQDGDGNCLFRAVSLQIYGDPAMHGDIRKQCMDFMERDQEHFSQFVIDEPFPRYIARKRQDGVHGNNPEIQAISELFNRPVEVFTPENGATPLNIFHAEYKTDDAPIRLSYHDGNHYNAVVDPLVPTAGLGLGLPGLQPGLADKLQMAKAVAESDAAADQMELEQAIKTSYDDEYHRAIKESKLSAEHASSNAALCLSDMDATYFDLEQAALERSLESYRQQEHGKKKRAATQDSKGNKEDEHGASLKVRSSISTGASSAMEHAIGDAYLPCPSEASVPVAAAAAAASVPVAASAAARCDSPVRLGSIDEYPLSVQELVMNGFSLSSVVKAFELVGNNFDDMLALLMANSSG